MTILEWFYLFLIIQVVHFAGTWKLYIGAGRKAWEAAIPIYNAIILMKIINRPWWWTFLLFVPIINLIMFPVIWVETLRSFGKNSTLDTFLGFLTFGLYIYVINYSQNIQHIPDRSLQPKKGIAEFVSSILFAIVVATTVHTYFIQPYTIPTSSLEKSLLIGDFLFVSKFHYGARTPMTTVSFPMVHDTIPVVKSKSYFSKPLLPYFRFPSFENIENNDIVVFNWPTDTVYYFRDPSKRHAYKPIDKKSNYVKRCLGIAGDSLQIKDGDVYINGNKLPMHDRQRVQFTHVLRLKEPSDIGFFENYEISMKEVFRVYQMPRNEWEKPGVPNFINGSNERENSFAFEIEKDSSTVTLAGIISNAKIEQLNIINDNKSFYVHMPDDQVAKLRNNPYVASVNRIVKKESDDKSIFPHSKNWTVDNMGPLYIPKAGVTVALNTESLPFYQRIISEYEGHDLKVMGNEIRIDGKIATSYTFAQDYYWMMGDNRHNSEDSRYWGFVPHDHIVGKPVFIWMSIDYDKKKIRWERLFTTVGGSGTPTSYFKLFLILLALYYGFDYFRKKMKDKKEINS